MSATNGDDRRKWSEDEGQLERDEGDLDEVLDRERPGSGEYEHDERYGRNDTEPDRERRESGEDG